MAMGTPHKLRAPCRFCAPSGVVSEDGYLIETNGQNVVRCLRCNRAVYNAPKVETGQEPRTVTTVHNGVRPSQRSRVLLRDSGRCVFCGSKDQLHVGHLLSVKDGLGAGLTELELNDDVNLITCCAECNLGMGEASIPPWIAAPLIRASLKRTKA